MKILVVDDTEANRKLLVWILEDEGHEIVEADNGQIAIEKFKEHSPDLVLMDVMMPVMDGFEATRAIKEYLGDDHVPIIFLTALSDDASLAKCLSIGGDDFLSKPINEQVLQAKIKAHSRIRELNEQIKQQHNELKKLHDYTMREQEIARTVFDRAMAASLSDCENTRHYVSPATTFNGDLLISAASPSGGLYVLLADFTGHGLPAALGALPVSQIFFDLTEQGASVSDISLHLNEALEKFLPDDMFCAAIILEMNSEGSRVTLWSGGMPDIIITSANNRHTRSIASQHMPLGVLETREFERDVTMLEMETGEHLYLYTDGIPESLNPRHQMYGEARMLKIFDGGHSDPFTRLIYDLKTFAGPGAQNDDVTLIEITAKPVELVQTEDISMTGQQELPWTINMDLQGADLKLSSPVSKIIDMIGSAPGMATHKDYIHTILSELYSNALEHGVLGLSSELKQTEDGYLEYYQQRRQKLDELQDGFVNMSVQFSMQEGAGKLYICIKDSGKGFDPGSRYQSNDDDSFGRGISLIDTLCDTVQYSENGTKVEIEYTIV